MKKTLFSIIILSSTVFNATAQNFTYPDGQHLVVDVNNENYESYNIDILTATPQYIHYQWELISNTCPSAWSYSLCDYGGCAVGIPSNGSMMPITQAEAMNNGTKGFFKLNLTVGQNYGQGKIEIYVYDANDHNFGDTVSWDISWEMSNTLSSLTAEKNVWVYPNPVKEVLSISTEDVLIEGVKLFTVTGKLVIDETLRLNQYTLNTSALDKGVYLLQVALEGDRTVQRKVMVE